MRLRAFLFFATLALVALACGPSYQALYEGDARFEHCYALEETAATMTARSDCWRDWMLKYTYGQTRDRVEYAAARYRALSRAPQAPTDEAMMEAAPGEGRESTIAAPAPTSAFEPPPKTLAETDAGPRTALPGFADASAPSNDNVVDSTPAATSPSPPGNDCTISCQVAWDHCKSKCIGACTECIGTYKKCMRGCFK